MHIVKILLAAALYSILIAGCGGGGSTTPAPTPVNSTSWATVGITGASRQTTVSWATAAKTTGATYNLYWATTPGVTKATGNKIANVTSPYVHTGLTNDTMYYYVVTAVTKVTTGTGTSAITKDVEGPESLEVATSPKAVLPLPITGVSVASSNASVQIKIDRTGAAATTKFNLYWSTAASLANATKIANAFGAGSTFQHTALANGATYYYAVTVETPEGESPKSKTVAATPLADSSATNYVVNVSPARIAAPNAVTAVAASQLVTLTWNMPANQIPTIFDPAATPTMTPVISSYTIYWSTAFISDISKANKISVPVGAKDKLPMSFAHNTGLANNTPYYYVITAVAGADANGNPLKNAAGKSLTFESPVSSQISVTPEAKAPLPPTGFTATSGNQQITLGWAKGASANTTYNVYASTTEPAQPQDLVINTNRIATLSTLSYTHSGLSNGTTYYYVVTAVTEGESAPSALIAISLW